jgi:hypothetical protein
MVTAKQLNNVMLNQLVENKKNPTYMEGLSLFSPASVEESKENYTKRLDFGAEIKRRWELT